MEPTTAVKGAAPARGTPAGEAPVAWCVEGGIGQIVLNRPDAGNTLDTRCARALALAIAAVLEARPGAIVLSAGGKQFCAGGDIQEFVARRADLERLVTEMLALLHPAIHALATAPMPVISAVHGPVGGAGIALALCADFVLAAPAMKLRGGYSAIGLSPDLGASYYLARRAGSARAKHILMANRAVCAEDCLRWGLVDELHPADALYGAAQALAAQLASGPRQALAGIKRLCDDAPLRELQEHLDLECDALRACALSVDAREGVSAFIDKRPPVFGGSSSTH